MPTLDEWAGSGVIKLLYLGDAASGKTGSLASLVYAGYNLRVIDFDKGLKVLQNIIKEKDPSLLKKVDVESFSDDYKNIGGRMVCTKAKAWAAATSKLSKWEPYGPLETWGPKDILVIDSITFAGRAAVNYILSLNSRLGQSPYQSDYLEAQRMVESLCNLLHDDSVKTNIICITHIRELSKTETKTNQQGNAVRIPISGTEQFYPETGTGQALSPTIGRYFNSILHCELSYGKRRIRTQPSPVKGSLALKSAGGSAIPADFPLETGLADYFKLVQG